MLRGILSGGLFALNTIFWCLLLYPLILMKALIPLAGFRQWITRPMIQIGELWISGNDTNMKFTQNIRWTIELPPGLSMNKSYIVVANHQSWMDIVILQHVFNRKIPFLRFFLKKELLYVPLLGLAWWALDYPFMKRHSPEYLRKHPEKRGEDLKTTRRSIEKFKNSNVSILNFLEGTRFNETKKLKQGSPYRHLLLPKAGGLAFALEAMKDKADSILDVTIIYPQGAVSLMQAFAGELPEVIVKVRRIPITSDLGMGSQLQSLPSSDSGAKPGFKSWVQNLWKEKDQIIESTLTSPSALSRSGTDSAGGISPPA